MGRVHKCRNAQIPVAGNTIDIEIAGERGTALLMPANSIPIESEQAETMRQWGADPALGRTLIDGLSDVARVVAFDYESHVMTAPKPDTLTPPTSSRTSWPWPTLPMLRSWLGRILPNGS